MVKQGGIIPLKGTIGNITFYKSKAGYLAVSRIASDPDNGPLSDENSFPAKGVVTLACWVCKGSCYWAGAFYPLID